MDGLVESELIFDLATGALTPATPTSPGLERIGTNTNREAEQDVLEAIQEIVAEEDDFDSVSNQDPDRENSSGLSTLRLKRPRPILVQLPASTLISPRSVCANSVPPVELVREWQAVDRLMRADPSQANEDFIEFELDKFSCYVDTALQFGDGCATQSCNIHREGDLLL